MKNLLGVLVLGSVLVIGCGVGQEASEGPGLEAAQSALTVEQCEFFHPDESKITICHETSSTKNPWVIIRINKMGCGGHESHAGDYFDTTEACAADPKKCCQEKGCYPELAPYDGTVECCAPMVPYADVEGLLRCTNPCDFLDWDDGVACTDDVCDRETGLVSHIPNNANCDNGLWCDGAELCDAVAGCVDGSEPCVPDAIDCTVDGCDEAADACTVVANNAACDDGVFCNGEEVCDLAEGCVDGDIPDCSDGIDCTIDSCDAGLDECQSVAPAGYVFNSATGTCDDINECLAVPNPCYQVPPAGTTPTQLTCVNSPGSFSCACVLPDATSSSDKGFDCLGHEWLEYWMGGSDVVYGYDFDDTIIGQAGGDKIYGGTGNDYIIGGQNDDQLFGEEGDDTIIGGDYATQSSGGADTIYGGDGNDWIFANSGGTSRLYGGPGADTFVPATIVVKSNKIVLFQSDFTVGQDRLGSVAGVACNLETNKGSSINGWFRYGDCKSYSECGNTRGCVYYYQTRPPFQPQHENFFTVTYCGGDDNAFMRDVVPTCVQVSAPPVPPV